MEKHVNPRKWRESREGWVGNKRTQFPSLTSFTLSIEKQDKAEQRRICCKELLLILGVDQVVKINPELEINYSWGIDGMCLL